MMDHAERFGWTPDSKEFGYCWEDGGLGGLHCTFAPLAGKAEELIDFERGSGEIDPRKTAALQARIAKHAVTPARWLHARDLRIVWEATKPAADAAPQAAFRPELRVGARVRGATSAALPIRIRGKEPYGTIHPEAIALSPDGKRLAVLSHAYWGEFSDTFELRLFAVEDLASQAYNAAGLELHERGEHARAAELFHRAAYANPTSKLPMYNLACALARLDDPGARKALELAIARGGPEVRAKALRDPDFERVRRSPWFTELVP
jgi:hypothetical protein